LVQKNDRQRAASPVRFGTLQGVALSPSWNRVWEHPEFVDTLERLDRPRPFGLQAAAVLALSIGAFYGLGRAALDSPASLVAALTAVVLIHELGHLAAMWTFGFADLRMLFIPLLGAAVSGRKQDEHAVRHAIVALAGPVPGLVIGAFVAFVMPADDGFWRDFVRLSIIINAFNLIPIEPLDGGRVLAVLLWERWPRMRSFAGWCGVAAIIGFGLATRNPLLAGFGILAAGVVPGQVNLAALGRGVRNDLENEGRTIPASVRNDPALAERLCGRLAAELGDSGTSGGEPQAIAEAAWASWEASSTRPAKGAATIAMLTVYATSVGLAVGVSAWWLSASM
jgi:Zn-dependent protease